MDKSWDNPGYPSFRATLAEQVNQVVSVPRDPYRQIELLRTMLAARLDEPVLIDTEIATRMVYPYSWLLGKVGDGITLTEKGFLPPRLVDAAGTELGIKQEWTGMYNREYQTVPVLELRQSTIKTGLLLAAVAAQLPEDALEFTIGWLERFGYDFRDGSPVSRWTAKPYAEPAYTVLLRTGAIKQDGILQPHRVSPQGTLFARAALRTWPR